jgi:hypothetical protein
MTYLEDNFYSHISRPKGDSNGLLFDACPSSLADVSFADDMSSMLVSGFVWNTVSSLPLPIIAMHPNVMRNAYKQFLSVLLFALGIIIFLKGW